MADDPVVLLFSTFGGTVRPSKWHRLQLGFAPRQVQDREMSDGGLGQMMGELMPRENAKN